MVAKALLGEPLQTNLINAQLTLSVYLVGMCSMLAAVTAQQPVFVARPLCCRIKPEQLRRLIQSPIGCLLLYVLPLYVLPDHNGPEPTTQFNYFQFLASHASGVPACDATRTGAARLTGSRFHSLALDVTIRLGILVPFRRKACLRASAAWAIAADRRQATGCRSKKVNHPRSLPRPAWRSSGANTRFLKMGRVYRNEQDVFARLQFNLLESPAWKPGRCMTPRFCRRIRERSEGLGGSSHWFEYPGRPSGPAYRGAGGRRADLCNGSRFTQDLW